jgi:hypothetical protein
MAHKIRNVFAREQQEHEASLRLRPTGSRTVYIHEIWGSHGGEYKYLMKYCAVLSRRYWPTFQRCLLLPSSGQWSTMSALNVLISWRWNVYFQKLHNHTFNCIETWYSSGVRFLVDQKPLPSLLCPNTLWSPLNLLYKAHSASFLVDETTAEWILPLFPIQSRYLECVEPNLHAPA